MDGGNFQFMTTNGSVVPNNTAVCERTVDLKMNELQQKYNNGNGDAAGVSKDLFDIVSESAFVSKDDKKRVVNFIDTIVKDAIKNESEDDLSINRQNIYTLGALISGKFDDNDTDLTLDSLKTIDYIGEKGTPVTIATSGIALLSQDTKIR